MTHRIRWATLCEGVNVKVTLSKCQASVCVCVRARACVSLGIVAGRLFPSCHHTLTLSKCPLSIDTLTHRVPSIRGRKREKKKTKKKRETNTNTFSKTLSLTSIQSPSADRVRKQYFFLISPCFAHYWIRFQEIFAQWGFCLGRPVGHRVARCSSRGIIIISSSSSYKASAVCCWSFGQAAGWCEQRASYKDH